MEQSPKFWSGDRICAQGLVSLSPLLGQVRVLAHQAIPSLCEPDLELVLHARIVADATGEGVLIPPWLTALDCSALDCSAVFEQTRALAAFSGQLLRILRTK